MPLNCLAASATADDSSTTSTRVRSLKAATAPAVAPPPAPMTSARCGSEWIAIGSVPISRW